MQEKILIIENHPKLLKESLQQLGFEVHQRANITYKELYDVIADYTGIVISSRLRVDRTFLNTAKNLKYILRPGSGLENVDRRYAEELGITCINSPEGNRDAVAEHAIGMLLNLFNHINRAYTEVKNGVWLRENNRGVELMGKTIGIIGFGNTGQSFAKKLNGFDVHILAYDKYASNEKDLARDAKMKDIFEKADIISFHLPLTCETKFIANDQFFRNFRKPIYVINTSRGQIIKTSSLINALERGAVLGACLDVLENEKLSTLSERERRDFNFLKTDSRVLLTPHIAGWSDASKVRMITELLKKFEVQINHKVVA